MVDKLGKSEMKGKQNIQGSMVMTREIDRDEILEKLIRMLR